MRHVNGLWCPDLGGPTPNYGKYLSRAAALVPIIERAKKKRVAVQAGGHIGLVPRLLAQRFGVVYTYEPERENFSCLVRNVEDYPSVFAARGVVGDSRGTVGLALHSRSSGGHNVLGSGPVPCYRIDDLKLSDCDLIQLDVEGMEVPALWGALSTISTCKPLVILEQNKKMHSKGYEFGDAEKLLAPFGYKTVGAVGEDLVFAA